MKSGRGLAFAVAGVAVTVFGASLLLTTLVQNSSFTYPSPSAVLGVLVAAAGMILSLAAASSIRE